MRETQREKTRIGQTQVKPDNGGRMLRAMWRQEAAMRRVGTFLCPSVDLRGRVAVVTGGSGGIGLEVCRALARMGARVILGARSAKSRVAASRTLAAQCPGAMVDHAALDLSDLGSVRAFADEVMALLGDARIDIFLQNAGLWPQEHALSAQGHEIAFATNVLGHFALTRYLLPRLDPPETPSGARVVVVTGDIYFQVSDCTPDFVWQGIKGGQAAYCRSKLGNLWIAGELQRRQGGLEVCAVHPGVVASGLFTGGPVVEWLKRRLLISNHRGAQTPLYCCVASHVEPGAYYHNTMGRVVLPASDPAVDKRRAGELWELCESLTDAASS